MQEIIEKLKEIESRDIGIIIYSQLKKEIVCSYNKNLSVPLASAAKIAIAFCVAKLVEESHFKWSDIVENIKLNPEEDSNIVYPHFQNSESLALQDAVEVMIACHDSFVANSIVQFCGGWEIINKKVKSYFSKIHITQNPRDFENNGELSQMLELLLSIAKGYKTDPELWMPIINGLVRQRDEIEGIPSHLLNHMSGGLYNVVVDIGIIGEFSRNPFLYVLGAKDLPNRNHDKLADELINDAMRLLYVEYCKEEDESKLAVLD